MATLDEVYEKLNKIENKLDALEPTLNTIEKLQESGIIGMLDGFAEEFDNIFNYATKMEIFDMITMAIRILEPLTKMMKKGDIEKLLSLLDKVEIDKLVPLLEAVASCAPKAEEVMSVSSRRKKKVGLMELMNTVRSPEMGALLSMAKELSGCMMENSKKAQK
jgi:uncharacterized protein YjgD (DUF1641 family)